jgi:small subunit ribosomal protein S5
MQNTENQDVQFKFEEEIVIMRRVAAKRSGGPNLRFSVLAAVGDRNGTLGIGLAKAKENVNAIRKAKEKARRSTFKVKLNENGSIPHEVKAKYGASKIFMKPAPLGAGIIAGSSVRQILELAGYKNISAKILDGSNKITNAYAVIEALKKLKED